MDDIKEMKQNAIDRQEIQKWIKRDIEIGETITEPSTLEECNDFPYLLPLISAFNSWKSDRF